jgi:nicotinamide mononucleotide adenylyltransferase
MLHLHLQLVAIGRVKEIHTPHLFLLEPAAAAVELLVLMICFAFERCGLSRRRATARLVRA